jgi:DNA-binding beta-propeller fold protein YncE
MGLAFSPDGRRVYSVSRNDEARVWEGPGRGNPRVLRDHTNFVYPVAYSPDARTLASGAWDRVIRLRDAASGETLRALSGHEQYIAGLAFSPDSRWLVSRGADETIRVWDVQRGKALKTLKRGGMGLAEAPHNVAVTPDGTRLACAVGDRLYFWELPGGREAGTLPLPLGTARAVQFSPDGRRMAVVGDSPDVAVLNATTGALLVQLQGHRTRVNAVAFSRDGARLVTAGNDQTVRLWDAATGECLRVFRGHTDEVFAAVFHTAAASPRLAATASSASGPPTVARRPSGWRATPTMSFRWPSVPTAPRWFRARATTASASGTHFRWRGACRPAPCY